MRPATHLEAMEHALRLAEEALAGGDRAVGAVVLDGEGGVLAARREEVHRRNDPLAHAVVLALRDAAAARGSWRLPDAVVVTTLEPCLLCAGAALSARVATVVLGAPDPEMGVLGSRYHVGADPRLNHEIAVIRDVLVERCRALAAAEPPQRA